jgi:hypothetical protein
LHHLDNPNNTNLKILSDEIYTNQGIDFWGEALFKNACIKIESNGPDLINPAIPNPENPLLEVHPGLASK